MTTSNPLVAFRNPKWLEKKTGLSHAPTKREDVVNDTEGLSSIYPGEFTYVGDCSLEIELAFWEDSDHPKSLSMYHQMTGSKGYNVALYDEWEIADRLKQVWQKDNAGRITLSGKSTNTMVLMWRTGEAHDIDQKRRLRWSDDIAKEAASKQAELQNKFAPLGAKVSVTIEDDDSR